MSISHPVHRPSCAQERAHQTQVEQQARSIENHIVEQHTHIHLLEQENRQLREQLGQERDEHELGQLLAVANQRIAQLEAERDQVRAELDRERRLRTEQYNRYFALFDWMRKLFANKSIPEACKLVLWQFYTVFFFMRAQATGEEMRISVEGTAAALGISTSTVRKATDKAEAWDVLTRRYEPITTSDGEKITLVHIELNDITAHPEHIQMEKLHGGKRIKKCPKCGSEDVDRYTVQYCRCCDENSWYGQPGLRNDADVVKAQRAQNTPLYKSGQKQDAFEDGEHEPDPIALSNRLDQALDATQHQAAQARDRAREHEARAPYDLPTDELLTSTTVPTQAPTVEKQDAFEQEATEFATEHLPYSQSSKLPVMEMSLTRCRAHIALNKDGEFAHALEKIVSYQECGSTRWIWSSDEQRRVCANPDCGTPLPEKEEDTHP